jgi:ATP synthase protein I
MPEQDGSKPESLRAALSQQVGAQETRKLKLRRLSALNVWSGFGMFGLIGWSIAGPTLLGALLGMWLDKLRPGTHFWTLALLVAGLSLGAMSAWHWVAKQDQAIRAAAENDE